jgi:hypothetical protein
MPKQTKETDLYNDYLKEYNRLAKKADRRMRELERFSRYEEFEGVLNYAYRGAKKAIAKYTPPGYEDKQPRWQRNAPMDTRTLSAKIKDIENFLNKPTSTITGVVKIYKKRTATINKKYGTKFTWQQLAAYFETGGLSEKSGDKFGSKTLLVAIGEIQAKKKTALDIIAGKVEDHIQVDDTKVQHTVDSLLSEYGKDLTALLNN